MDYDLTLSTTSTFNSDEVNFLKDYHFKDEGEYRTIRYSVEESTETISDLVYRFLEKLNDCNLYKFQGSILDIAVYFESMEIACFNISLNEKSIGLLSKMNISINFSCYPCID